jgi:deazaflavin-dependent oxidoreductase (nitroreductase family)
VVSPDEVTYTIEAGHGARLMGMADDDFCYLTTRGRVTGQPHEIEIWYARDADTLYLMSGSGDHAEWVQNLRAYSAVTIRVDGTTHHGNARILEDGAEERKARDLVFEKYQPRYDGSLRGWRHAALPVAVDLLDPQS